MVKIPETFTVRGANVISSAHFFFKGKKKKILFLFSIVVTEAFVDFAAVCHLIMTM